ncbi:33896_t:CDS:2, partial [Racocetra persica]
SEGSCLNPRSSLLVTLSHHPLGDYDFKVLQRSTLISLLSWETQLVLFRIKASRCSHVKLLRPLIHLPLDTAPLGCNETGKNRKGRISSKCTLHQRQVDPKTGRTYEPLLTSIANVLTCGLYVTHHNNPLLIPIALKLAALPHCILCMSICPYNEAYPKQ